MARLRIPRRGRPMSRPAPWCGGSWSREAGRPSGASPRPRAHWWPLVYLWRKWNEWLQHLARQAVTPKPCRDVLVQNVPRFRFWCQHVEPSGSAMPPSVAPLPSDVRIVPPVAAVPKQLAAFSGKWSGVWDGILPHVLVVEEITPPHAVVIYAWGTAPQWQTAQPGWSRVQGEFVEGVLKLSLRRPATAMYRLQPDGTLDATYAWAGGLSRANLTPVKE